uniref:Single stranded DNA binding protein 4 n=1 Tax=Aquila chrysaetos chrysaetos TaxID=223781 RepID=A0A663EB46_AQUCH
MRTGHCHPSGGTGSRDSSSSPPPAPRPGAVLALYVYEYLLHVGAQKSAQTFLSEIRWEKNITLGEPPGFLHSWWCVFWDLYCAAPDRRETCEHSSEAKAFHDYPFMSPRYPGGPRPPLRMPNQPPVGVPGSQPLLPNAMDPAGIPAWGGPMQRMNPPRGMAPGPPHTPHNPPPQSRSWAGGAGWPRRGGGAQRPAGPPPPHLSLLPSRGPGGRGPWPNPSANSVSWGGGYLGGRPLEPLWCWLHAPHADPPPFFPPPRSPTPPHPLGTMW